jgi:macrodomain Ter protein organizer (MatP/YcbG family)
MGAIIELEPEVIERLTEKAREQGQTVNDFLRKVMDEMEPQSKETDELSLTEIDQLLDELATDGLATLPKNFSREDIYVDHD